MSTLGIDPGSKQSGIVIWTPATHYLVMAEKEINNEKLLEFCRQLRSDVKINLVAIECIRGYGIVAGNDTFITAEWVGRFMEACYPKPVKLITRKEVKLTLCGTTTTNDKYIRQALIDRYGEVGTKKAKGPLFEITGHCWAALSVAIVAGELK